MPAKPSIIVMWFRQDLRIADNPALMNACRKADQVLPIYILDDENCGRWRLGAASRWWLRESLRQLDGRLDGRLCIAKGDALKVLKQVAREFSVEGVYWNRCYEPWRIRRDTKIKAELDRLGIDARSWNGSLLVEPHEAVKADGKPYRVFTPFFERSWLPRSAAFRAPLGKPRNLNLIERGIGKLGEPEFLPGLPWRPKWKGEWQPGEIGAENRLRRFLGDGLKGYATGRDFPELGNVSRLSPHLHFGEISPNRIWSAVANGCAGAGGGNDAAHFIRELAWREFSYGLLYFCPELPRRNLHAKFDLFPWRENGRDLEAWQEGRTGFPIVDAGMRELLQTGYMHNRVRMIAASLLVKNLLVHWRCGAEWFWDKLVDADLASNSASWQWVAGSGADAAPYFRIFNPVRQGQNFDPDGLYVRRFCPELSKLSNSHLHAPWLAPAAELENAGILLGKTYPRPIVDLKVSRTRALEAFAQIKDFASPR